MAGARPAGSTRRSRGLGVGADFFRGGVDRLLLISDRELKPPAGFQLAGQALDLEEEVKSVLGGKIVSRGRRELHLLDEVRLILPLILGILVDPVGEDERAYFEGGRRRHGDLGFRRCELLGDHVLEEQIQLVGPFDEREQVLEAEKLVLDLDHLVLAELDRDVLLVLVNGDPLEVGDDGVDLEGRVEPVPVLFEGEPLGFDEEVDEGHSRPVPDDVDREIVVDIIGRVFDADAVLVFVELFGVGVLDLLSWSRRDLGLDEDLGGDGRGCGGLGLPGYQGHGDARDGRLDLHELLISRQVIGHVAIIIDQKGFRAVFNRAVERPVPGAFLLEENDIEGVRKAVFSLAVVEPDDDRENLGEVLELVDGVRLAQDDVDPAHGGPPSGPRRFSSEKLVGIGDTAEMLLFEFVLGGVGVRVPLLPEGLDEELPFPVVLEPEKNLFLLGRDDVDDLLVEPFLVFFREILDRFHRLAG